MQNYSIVMLGNPSNQSEAKKAYAIAQYSEIMELQDFSQHIADHGSVYSRADISAVLTQMVDCMRELLLKGHRIKLGDLGVFGIRLKSKGANSAAEFTAANITDAKASWLPGKLFKNLVSEMEFNLVTSRKAAAKVIKAVKAGETSVDLTDATDENEGA